MKNLFRIILILIISNGYLEAQDLKHLDKDKESPKKILGISDRAGGTHNASNIGLFFENRGKLYPRRITQGPSGEFPINSGKHYIYRINPFVGIPGNVVQGRHTTNEEWEAVGGYHNPEFSQIAFSDNSKTWPSTGWPVKDENGNPIIKSDQDSYCVFSDSNNSRPMLGVQLAQTGYTYGVKFAQNLIFFKYDLTNTSNRKLDSVYFSFYADMDIGNISGGVPEYGDDKIGFDKEKRFVYFHDDGISTEWPGGKTGHFGVALLKTPEVNGQELGLTDMHYFLYYDDEGRDIDTIQYGIMSSARSLYESSLGPKYFHPGSNGDIHYDDPSTIPEEGIDLGAMLSSGPYILEPGQTITFYTAIVAGENLTEAFTSLDAAYRILEFDFEISKPPATPTLNAVAGNGSVTLYWDDVAESSRDNFSGEFDFEGYRLYKSQDKGVTWNLLSDFDLINKIGLNTGLQYSYTDQNVANGFEYWYSVTAYDRGDSSISSLESPKGNNTDAINLKSVQPLSKAAGYNPTSASDVTKSGNGLSNYVLDVMPVDDNTIANNNYQIGFNYVWRKEKGKNNTIVEIIIRDSSKTNMTSYGIEWLAPNKIQIYDYTAGDFLSPTPKSYISGARYNLNPGLAIRLVDPEPGGDPQFLPKVGDYISVNFGVYALRNNNDTVIHPRQIEIDQIQSTTDGVVFKLTKPEIIQDVSKIGGTDNVDITFDVDDETLIQNGIFFVSTSGRGFDSQGQAFVSITVKDETQTTIAVFDTLYNYDSFTFNGITGTINFNSNNAPSPGNIFSLTVIKPIALGINDKYNFSINSSFIDKMKMQQEISNIKVVPNPYIVSSLYEPEFGELRREPLRQIQFINLPNECTIHIFTIDADLIKTLHHSSNSGTEIWDLRAEGGREIAPGIYIYVVTAEEIEFKSRFAIIK